MILIEFEREIPLQCNVTTSTRQTHRCQADLLKGLVAGAAGGLVGTAAMTLVQNTASKLGEPLSRTSDDEDQANGSHDEPATVQAATAVARRVFHADLDSSQKAKAGQAVHFGFGTTMGALYGVAAEYEPRVRAGRGAAWGAALMIVADEIGIPLARLGPPPTRTPISTHFYALLAHLTYGVTCETVRERVRSNLG